MKTDLVEIFQTIRASLQPYAASGFTARTNTDTAYELWSEKNVDVNGEPQTEIYFAGVLIGDGAVQFKLRPIKEDASLKNLLHENLLVSLNNDDSFKITALDENLMEQINDAIVIGYTNYKQKGWV